MENEPLPPRRQLVDVDGETVGVLLADGDVFLFRAFKPLVATLDWTCFQSPTEGRSVVELQVRTARQFSPPSGPSTPPPDRSD